MRWAFPFGASSSSPRARGPLAVFGECAVCANSFGGSAPCRKTPTVKTTEMTRPRAVRYNVERAVEQKREAAMDININDKAPEFTLPDQNGEPVSLKDFRGQWVVLYFYPRADTPGCTIEACEFRDS